MNPNDPLDEFFRQQRESIDPLPTSEAHWQSIVAEHRRTRRSRAWTWVGAAAAAAVAVGTLGLLMRPDPSEGNLPGTRGTTTSLGTPTPPTTPSDTGTPTGTGTPTTEPTSPPATKTSTGPVLKDFDVVSVTNAGRGTRAALGRAMCGSAPCSAVVTSSDDGAHWTVAASFEGEVPAVDGLRTIRFASADIGYLVGKTVKRTTDGGKTWKDFGHPGKRVFGLETDGRDVVIVAGDSETVDGTHELVVSRAPISGTEAAQVGEPLTNVSFFGADVVWSDHQAFVLVRGAEGAGGIHRVDAKAVTHVPAKDAPNELALTASAGDPALFLFTSRGGATGSAGIAVHRSVDGGKTWTTQTPAGAEPLLLANAGQFSFVATDSEHLVAVSGGSSDLHGSMKISADGGHTWQEPTSAPPMPDRGWAWVGSPGNGVVYAIPVEASGAYWWSADHGATWKQAVLNR